MESKANDWLLFAAVVLIGGALLTWWSWTNVHEEFGQIIGAGVIVVGGPTLFMGTILKIIEAAKGPSTTTGSSVTATPTTEPWKAQR